MKCQYFSSLTADICSGETPTEKNLKLSQVEGNKCGKERQRTENQDKLPGKISQIDETPPKW